ncbi:MAG: acyl-CoA thioesterase [Mycobacterium sp.]
MTANSDVGPVLQITPRWTDLDPIGHVNNSVFLVYAEKARARYLREALPDAWSSVVLVHNAINYRHPVEETDLVAVSSVVDSVGTTSMSTVNVVATGQGKCATVKTVQVVMNDDRSGTRPWTGAERTRLEGLVGNGPEIRRA